MLARLLRYGTLLDVQQRLARGSVQDVDPAGLGDLGDALARLAAVAGVEQHDRIG